MSKASKRRQFNPSVKQTHGQPGQPLTDIDTLPDEVASKRERRPDLSKLDVIGLATHLTELGELTFMDPCCGAGHFLREAFDMYMEMYREQFPWMRAYEMICWILKSNLHGIDLDERAAQLARFTVYLRAQDFIRAECRLEKRLYKQDDYPLPLMKIVGIPNKGSTASTLTLDALKEHFPDVYADEEMRGIYVELTKFLKEAEEVGSLTQPETQGWDNKKLELLARLQFRLDHTSVKAGAGNE